MLEAIPEILGHGMPSMNWVSSPAERGRAFSALTDLQRIFRTDRATLAVNGFAADGNMFVKTVKQRLEVSLRFIGAPVWSEFSQKLPDLHTYSSGIAMPIARICH